MARRCAAYGHALSAARSSLRRREPARVAGDALGSWRSTWGFYRVRIAHDIAAWADGIALIPKNEGQARKRRRGREAFGHARRHRRATLLTVGNGRVLWRTARHVVCHLGARHNRGGRHRGAAHRRSNRPRNEPYDRKDREQSAEPYADLHWRAGGTGAAFWQGGRRNGSCNSVGGIADFR